ncbi:pilus assembly protein [Candidatus Gracilibacteria bacterium]|nr:pilus assembly protein [Candidatus Gracilibacteria bacterium]
MKYSLRNRLQRARRSTGQALVEFALAATLIFFLFGIAIDGGLIFFTLQQLRTAAQEGAVYGSTPNVVTSGVSVSKVDYDYAEIVERVRLSAGDGKDTSGFANLLDLDGDGADDGAIDATQSSSFIYIENLKDVNNNADPSDDGGAACDTSTPRRDLRSTTNNCYIRVTVRYRYNFLFPLLPSFADQITLQNAYILKTRAACDC